MGQRDRKTDRIKIAWFTPFNKESAIGRYSRYATEVLSRWYEIDLFVHQDPDKQMELHETELEVITYRIKEEILTQLNAYDVCVYNMGDNVANHDIIYDTLQSKPGIVIAHDICMHNFMRGYYFEHLHDSEEYYKLLERHYGNNAKENIRRAENHFSTWQELDMLEYNMSEDIYEKALGIIVHSYYHEKFVEKTYHGPVLVVPLLYQLPFSAQENGLESEKDKEKLEILTVGMVNPNKHIDKVVEAIGQSKTLRNRVHYKVIGSLNDKEYVRKIRNLIKKYNLDDCVSLLGYMTDEEMQPYYAMADLIVNLRYPALEGGSASLMEALHQGKNIMVTNTGVYAEIPDNCVYKIPSTNMAYEVGKKISAILNGEESLKKGKQAQEYAAEHFSDEKYGSQMKKLIAEVVYSAPMYEIISFCKQTTDFMPDTPINEILAKEMYYLYSDEFTQKQEKKDRK